MVTITASPKGLSAQSDGSYKWGKDSGVTITGYDADGSLGKVVFSDQFQDHGFGVDGPNSRWSGQIDYVRTDGGRGPSGNGVAGGSSEALVIEFQKPVKDVQFNVGMMAAEEGKINGNKILPETGMWTAYDASGKVIGTGKIGPDYSVLGSGDKVPGSYGEYPFAVDVGKPIASLRIEATEFDYGRTSEPGFFNIGDSSDFALTSISFESSTSKNPPVVEQPDDKPVAGKPDDKPVAGKPDDKPVAGKPDDKPVAGKPDDKPVAGKPDDKPVVVNPNDDFSPARIGTDGSDRMTGTDGNDRLLGLKGNDIILGGAGDDYIDGGHGRDTINGGAGNDTLIGGGGKDTFVFNSDFGDDVILDFSSVDTLKIEVDSDLAVYIDRSGSLSVSDGFVMAYGDEVLELSSMLQSYGKNGIDGYLSGSDLILKFGTGSSVQLLNTPVVVKSEETPVVDDPGDTPVVVKPDEDFGSTQRGTDKADRMTGTEGGDKLLGLKGNDIILGGAGDDYIDGGHGRDTINGGAGNDTLIGGGGKDTFVFNGDFGDDVILDFSSVDTLKIEVDNDLAAYIDRSSSLSVSDGFVMAYGDEVLELSSLLQSYGKNSIDSYENESDLIFELGIGSSVELFDYI